MKELNIKITDNVGGCLVTLDGEPVGLIQSVKVDISVESPQPKVEVVFPDLRPYESNFKDTLLGYLQDFSEMPFVTVKFTSLELPAAVEPATAEESLMWEATDVPESTSDLRDPRDA